MSNPKEIQNQTQNPQKPAGKLGSDGHDREKDRLKVWSGTRLSCPRGVLFHLLISQRLSQSFEIHKLCEMFKGKSWYVVDVQNKTKTEVMATPINIYEKVKLFFKNYAIHRHKMNILTNAIHATNYSPDDNRFDHRPFLLNIWFPKQMNEIKALAEKAEPAWIQDPQFIQGKVKLQQMRNTNVEAKESQEIWKEIWRKRMERVVDPVIKRQIQEQGRNFLPIVGGQANYLQTKRSKRKGKSQTYRH